LKETQNPIEIRDYDAVIYPWYRTTLRDWEYKIVKMQGYFKEDRFFIRRERAGKEGYLVFAPFITSIKSTDHTGDNPANPNVETGIFVNLGWVPLENRSDIELSNEPIPALEPPTNR